jgi:LruC domain-containing protein
MPNEMDLQKPQAVIASLDAIQVLENLSIPNSFNFETERAVTLHINDASQDIKYQVYAYDNTVGSESENISEALNNLLYSGKLYNNSINQMFSLSNIYTKVYILRKEGLAYSSEIIDVLNNKIDFTKTKNKNGKKTATSSNSNDDACALSTNILNNSGTYNFPASNEGLTVNIARLDNSFNMVINGTSLVPLEVQFDLGSYNSNRNQSLVKFVSDDSYYSYNGNSSVWGTSNTIDSPAVKLNISATGVVSLQGRRSKSSPLEALYIQNSDAQFNNITINADAANTIVVSQLAFGPTYIKGNYYGYNCPSSIFYPTEYTNATLAFEDQWPYTGDYDFNDLIIGYNIETMLNSENKVTQIDYNYTVQSIGGSYTNGFGVELEGVLPSSIESVTGSNLTEGIITNSLNGTEEAQPNAVIIFFDNSHTNVGLSNTISIVFSNPISTTALGTAPFNPFLIIDKDRNKEIHLPTKPTTYYPTTTTIETSPTVKDPDGDFKSPQGLPWAINIAGDYKAPKEKIIITDVYNHFADWATSGGDDYTDWYQNSPGNINISKLKD